jgi:PKD repeat protein
MAQPWPPGTEPGFPDADLGWVKPDGEERARDWADQHPGQEIGGPGGDIDPAPLPGPPAASFTYSPPSPGRNQNVTFDGSASQADGELTITSWTWLFNNTDTGSGQVVTWQTPNKSGSYPAQLTVTDSGGQTDAETQVLTI